MKSEQKAGSKKYIICLLHQILQQYLRKNCFDKAEQIDDSFVFFELLNFNERKERLKENKNILFMHINTYY